MSRFNLPSSETSKIFKTRLEAQNFDRILREIDKEQLSLFRDLGKLEEVFLFQNVDEFQKKEFRINLLKYAFGNERFLKFCQKINQKIDMVNSTDVEKLDFVKKIASFEWDDNEITNSFLNSFELDFVKISKKEDQFQNIEYIESPEKNYESMFFYQTEVWDKINNVLDEPAGKRIIQLPTGGGKTKIAMESVVDFFNKYPNSTVVWLATSQELLEQAIKEFKKIWSHRGTTSISINRVWDKFEFEEEVNDSRLIVAGLLKLNSFFKKNGKLKADLIIFDEAHHASAEKFSEVQDNLRMIGKTKFLGLTATPARHNLDETEKLAEMFGDHVPIKIETHDQYLSPIGFLQKEGVLSKVRVGGHRIIKIHQIEEILTEKEIKSLQKSSEYPKDSKIIKKIAQDHVRNITIFRKLYEILKEGKQVIYFGTSVEQAKLMYMILLNLEFKVGFIDNNTPKSQRAELIEKFQRKEINCLLNFAVLIAGFDSPSIDTVFIARLTKSANTLFQMIGRGIRGPKVKGGTEFCDVYHVQDGYLEKFENFDQLYDTYDDYFQQEGKIEE